MNKIRVFQSLILTAVYLAACAPRGSSVSPSPTAVQLKPTALPALDTSTPAAAAPSPLSQATSRGPELHATDPATVSLASGELQLVEFFRFT